MRLLIIGQRELGAATFERCRELGHEVAAVCAPMPAGGQGRVDPLYAAAIAADVPVISGEPEYPGGSSPTACPIDLLIAAHCHRFITPELLACARLGGIGYHPSLLPLHRGRDAIRWALHMRERVTGGTVYWLSDGVDGGDVAAQEHVFIRPDDTPRGLWERELLPLGLRLIERVLGDVAQGRIVRRRQDEELATWEPAFARPGLAGVAVAQKVRG